MLIVNNLFSIKYTSTKEPVGSHDIFFEHSRHVESIILMTKCGSEEKK